MKTCAWLGTGVFDTTGAMQTPPARARSLPRVVGRAVRTAVGSLGLAVGLATMANAVAQLFPDPQLEAAVRRQVFAKRDSLEPLSEADVVQVSTVEARDRGIRRLDGLEKCRNLAMLDLGGNQVIHLAPLAGLPRLQFLDLQGNQVEDLTPLATNVALQYLHLASNRLRSVAPVAGLTNLSALYLSGNRLEDLAPVLGLRRLASLYLDDNRLRSIEGLGGLRSLSSLSLSGNRIADLRPLRGLGGVQYLFLERNRIQDLAALIDWLGSDPGQRMAPFLNLYLADNPLGSEARTRQLEQIRGLGVRVHDAPVSGIRPAITKSNH